MAKGLSIAAPPRGEPPVAHWPTWKTLTRLICQSAHGNGVFDIKCRQTSCKSLKKKLTFICKPEAVDTANLKTELMETRHKHTEPRQMHSVYSAEPDNRNLQ